MTAIEAPGTGDEVLWTRWTRARLDTYRGNCARILHRTTEAIDVLENVLGLIDSRVIPARSNPLADLAIAYSDQHEIEHACDLLADAFSAANTVGYAEGVNRILDLRSNLLAKHSAVSAVRRLDELIRTEHL